MRVSVSHHKQREEVVKAVDRSFDELFRGSPSMPLKIENEQRSWAGSVMTFSFNARAGILSNAIKGTVEVTDRDVIIDADLGLLERLLGGSARSAIESRVKGLLT